MSSISLVTVLKLGGVGGVKCWTQFDSDLNFEVALMTMMKIEKKRNVKGNLLSAYL